MLYSVIITDGMFPDHSIEESVLKGTGIVEKIEWEGETDLVSKIVEADALLVQYASITRDVLRRLKRCKVIVRYGIGVDNIDLEAARERGIRVCNVPDYCLNEVADHTIAMALAAIRQIGNVDREVRNGNWPSRLPQPVLPFSKLDFCLVGFGGIAREVARRALGLGFRVSAYDPYTDSSIFENDRVTESDLDTLMARADVLSLHIPSTPETRHIINECSIGKMKASALIINTSRGTLIDSSALADALAEGRIAGAALDVFETEPLSLSDRLRDVPNVILSSHIAWYSEESLLKLQENAAEEIRRVLGGQHPRYAVN